MDHSPVIQLIPYLIALSSGFIPVCTSVFLFIRHRNRVYLYFSLLSFSMLTKMLHVTVKLYFTGYPPANADLLVALKMTKAAGLALLLYVLPMLIHHVMLLRLTFIKKLLFASMSIYVVAENLLRYTLNIRFEFSYAVNNLIFAAVMIYCIGAVIMNLRNVTDGRLKKIVVTFLVLVIVFLPFGIIDNIAGETGVQLPLYFFIINVLSVIFLFFYLVPSSAGDGIGPGDDFYKRYGITGREREIIALMRMGCSNAEIGQKTGISNSTVEKHVYSIYRKLDIKNRVQLLNMLRGGA